MGAGVASPIWLLEGGVGPVIGAGSVTQFRLIADFGFNELGIWISEVVGDRCIVVILENYLI